MVFTSVINLIRSRGPDEFWRKRKIFKLAAHYVGRRRNCYSIAIRNVHRALVYATKGRKLKRIDFQNLWETRLKAGCYQHDVPYSCFGEALSREQIMLNKKTMANLACWEPYTFKALTDVAQKRIEDDSIEPYVDKGELPSVTTAKGRAKKMRAYNEHDEKKLFP